MLTTKMRTTVIGVVALLLGAALAADAATVRVRCEKRADRSRISVDGNDLAPGNYTAKVTSPAAGGTAVTSAAQAAVGDEAAFDFDSNANNIALGATAIGTGFIQITAGGNNDVKGEILDASNASVASASVDCAVK